MNKKELIKELENYKYDYEYFIERYKNAKELNDIINELNTTSEKINDTDTTLISLNLKDIADEQVREETALLGMIKRKHEIEERIDDIQQPYRSVLLYRYVSLYSFGEIAKKMNYSTKRIYQLHQKGIDLYVEKYSSNNIVIL